MEALNKKERQSALFKFSLIYFLSFLFLGLLFWQIKFVPAKVEGGGTQTIKSSDFEKLKKESEFLRDEIEKAKSYINSSMGSLGYADEKLEFYYTALRNSGEDALLNKDVRNNQQVAKSVIDSMQFVIKKGYEVDKLPVDKKESGEASIEKALKHLSGVMQGFVAELENRNAKNRYLTQYADEYFNCLGDMAKISDAGGNPTKQIAENEIKRSMLERELSNRDVQLLDLKSEIEKCEKQIAGTKGLEECTAKRETLKKEIEKVEKELGIIAGKIKGKGNRSEENRIIEITKSLLELRQNN